MVDLWRDFWIRETGTGQQVAQLHDRCWWWWYSSLHHLTEREGCALSVLPQIIKELQNVVTVPEFIACCWTGTRWGHIFPQLMKGRKLPANGHSIVKCHCHEAQTEDTNVKLASRFAVLTRIFVSRLDDIFNSKNHLKICKRKLAAALKNRPTKLFIDLQLFARRLGWRNAAQEPETIRKTKAPNCEHHLEQ